VTRTCHARGVGYLNNRYQDPTTGVFISVDPLVGKTGTPYLYAAGNPTTLSDPNGLEPGCGATAFSSSSCGDAHQGAFRVPGRFQDRKFTTASVSVDKYRFRAFGVITIDMFIAAPMAGALGMQDEGNDRGMSRGAQPSESKVQVRVDLISGTVTMIAAPSCDKNGEGCHDARSWQILSSADQAIDASMNNILVSSDNDELRVQIRAKNSRRDTILGGFVDVPSIDRVYRLDRSSGVFAIDGDTFPSEFIYGTDYFGNDYEIERFDEQRSAAGFPTLEVADWSSLRDSLPLT